MFLPQRPSFNGNRYPARTGILYISKYNGSSYDLIFDSSVIRPITNTSYILPSGYLVNGGQYRWNMASHNSSGYGTPNASRMYFTVSIVSTLPASNLVSPGRESPGPSVSTTTPIFQWQSVSGADGYALYISKYNGSSYDLIFDSSVIGGPITNTSYILPSGYLVNGGQYRWNMASHNSSGYGTPNASRMYFTVSIVSTLPAPNLVSPGTGSAPGPSVSTTTPIFQWQSVSGADGYALYISKYNGSSYDLIFDSSVIGGPITNTSYILPSGYLVNGGNIGGTWPATIVRVRDSPMQAGCILQCPSSVRYLRRT
ncbi:MAG: hypothetical protein HS132_03335 [Planctomycetia bacterium]|nr:hypothetical protein [Planctomycetia bacterium]